ncbi:O-antigen ligase like membrane protein [Formosa agariphila KMM 3901]|uniref:O-antigen ligase like membrane protein n=1 Tax=Formosa agariphila (strain DSM 15362 / KCTC 12365 / LMG 23005 / KMM 3901 / M-2Alg 35-1) TaxID=1347342 RepID=T2KM72_FORAG|nr:O-antigen ligase family protein [Formosa agariphila]CDF79992.1 O-antigen ligase like membrane protein [Formosa agariphila KMM 3901]
MKYIIAFLIILFASFTDIFLSQIGIIPVEPAYFLIPLFFVLCLLRYHLKELTQVFKTHTFKLLFIFLLFSIIYTSFSSAPIDTIITEITLNIITILIYIFTVQFFRSENKKIIFAVFFISFLILSSSIWYDLFFGLPKHTQALEDLVRKGGFGANPNRAAAGLKFLSLGALYFLQRNNLKRNMFILVMVASVFITFSRGGLVSILFIIILGYTNNWDTKFNINFQKLMKNTFKMIMVLASLYIGLLVFADYIKEKFPIYAAGSAGERLDYLLGKGDSTTLSDDVGSGNGRGDLVIKFANEFMSHPLGQGTAYSSDIRIFPQNTHNFYLFIGVNYGFIVLIIYLIYLLYSLKLSFTSNNFFYFILVLLLLFEGIVSHYFLYIRAVIICIAFFDSVIIFKQKEDYQQNFIEKL